MWLTVHSDYVPLVNLISVYFQIRDDYMNLQSSEVRYMTKREQLSPFALTVHLSTRTIKDSPRTCQRGNSASQ